MSTDATKPDLRNITDIDTSTFAKNADLASLSSDVHQLHIIKLETTPFVFCRLCKLVKNDVNKKTVFDKLLKKVIPFRLLILVI